ncbi:hypothetical protein AYR55_03735 [Loigolactobacillus backii]|uniref:putative HNHc nuclease n=1 Tax=Loigolactobacillus backii TaxID=375175 RepID=UPI0007F12D30|nr:putative HNHc nuclease [Loigolactobacillus backii]ANK66893.1 hypothetical protein AYR55_03735 [Loigolactobacillus backii]
MKLFGELDQLSGNQLKIKLNDDAPIYRMSKLANGRKPTIQLDIEDGRTISPDQRKKIWALIRDISEWNGDVPQYIEDLMKSYTREIFNLEPYSLSNCSVTIASYTIETILEFCFRNDVPFSTRTWDMLPNDYTAEWFCLRFRKCIICGKHADIAHYEAVGMGNNRRKISHAKFHFMALCRIHHTEQHTIGVDKFLQKYHIKPIKLNYEERKKLRIGGKGDGES